MNRGVFITLEGIDGAGKSTQLGFIASYLNKAGVDFIVTREPGGTPLGEEVRSILLKPREGGVTAKAELMLILAARVEHLQRKIIPALEFGQWVLCNRFTDATYAYQGGGRQLNQNLIKDLEAVIHNQLHPDVTIYLDLPVEIGLERARQRAKPDRFELERAEFFNRVRACYQERARSYPDVFRIIDASQNIDDVQMQIREILDKLTTI